MRRLLRLRVVTAGLAVVFGFLLALFHAGAWSAGVAAFSVWRLTAFVGRLRARRALHRAAIAAAPLLAAHVAVQLRSGDGPFDRVPESSQPAWQLAGRICDVAHRALRLGLPVARALDAAVAQVCPQEARSFGAIIGVLALKTTSAGATSVALTRLASALEADARSQREAAATATEARFVAWALPVLTICMTCVIATLSPRALAFALAPIPFVLCTAGLLVAISGAVVVSVATRPC